MTKISVAFKTGKLFFPTTAQASRIIRLLTLLIGTFLLMQKTDAQFNETIFYDTLTKISREGVITGGYGEGKYMYLTGGSFSDQKPIPSVTKMDTGGNVIWTAIDPEITGLLGKRRIIDHVFGTTTNFLKEGNRIYVASRHQNLWCLSDSSGAMIWNTPIPGDLVLKVVSYSETELLLLTGRDGVTYSIINKESGKIVYQRRLVMGIWAYNADLFIDDQKNILFAWGDTCFKYRNREMNQLVWKTSLPFFSQKEVRNIRQDSARYILFGYSSVRAVDSATGTVIWYTPVGVGFIPNEQSGSGANPAKIIIRDSMIYLSWVSPSVGGLDLYKSFTLTCINKNNGYTRYNVAHDFSGIPPDSSLPHVHDELDWPLDFCFDESGDIYMTGSYDHGAGPSDPGNWGIMKINGSNGQKIYESTITLDSTHRMNGSQGLFIDYKFGRLYAAGNLSKQFDRLDTKPVLVSFDTSNTYRERFRISPFYAIRYPSSLVSMEPVSNSRMVLLKMVGRSGQVEMRTGYNQVIWTKNFSSPSKFMIPELMANLNDTAIAVSFYLYKEEPITKAMLGEPDSMVFVRLDTSGNLKYRQQIAVNPADTIIPIQIYTDPFNKTNFIFRRTFFDDFNLRYVSIYDGYMLGGTATGMHSIAGQYLPEEEPRVRKNVVSHYNVDTMVTFRTYPGMFSNGHFFSTAQNPAGYPGFITKRVRNFQMIYSCLKLDTESHLLLGRDSSGQMLAARYNFHQPNTLVWNSNLSSGKYITSDTSSSHIYVLGSPSSNDRLVISKIDKSNGLLSWNVEKIAALNSIIVPLDLRYDGINKQFSVGGIMQDTTSFQIKSSYFYFTLDSNGAIIKDVVRAGDLRDHTKIRAVNTLKNGTHFYGGQLAKTQYGIAGFYNSDCYGNFLVPSVSITASSTTACPGDNIRFTASPLIGGVNPQYQWKVNGINAGTGTDTFNINTLSNNDVVSVEMTSDADCLQTITAQSNSISVTVTNPQYPTILLTGSTTVWPDYSSLINTTVNHIGSNAIYQWQDSTQTHGWQNIAGANGTTLSYKPRVTGDKLRCIVWSSVQCAPNYEATSNVLQFLLDVSTGVGPDPAIYSGIRYYPNPVTEMLIVDSLKLSDRWETIEFVSINGKLIQDPTMIRNQHKVSINLRHLPGGIYIALLRRRQGSPVYFKFVRM